MKIALITRRFEPNGGGTERDLIASARCLVEAGHDITIYAGEVRAPSTEWRIRTVATPPLGRALRLLIFARSAGALARAEGNDLILSFARIIDADILRSGGSAHASYLRAARRWRNSAGAIAMKLAPYHIIQRMIERRGFHSARLKKAIAVSDLVRDDLIREFRMAPDRVVTLYNGVDLMRFAPARDSTARRQLRQTIAIPDDAPVVLFIGNGFARKGLRFLLRAAGQAKRKMWLMVAGNDRAIDSYQRLARRLRISPRVLFLGAQARVERLFEMADVLALPSLFEPFGNVALEAMAAGLPVVTSAQCGVTALLPPALRPFVIQHPSDPGEIAARLTALLEVRGTELGEAARATAEQFSWQRYAIGLTAIVETLSK
ncbi:MAG: glycosyltransferase family 4 protein [Candidatus Binataceae bacterium]